MNFAYMTNEELKEKREFLAKTQWKIYTTMGNNEECQKIWGQIQTIDAILENRKHVLTFTADNCNDESWNKVIEILKNNLNNFEVYYGNGDEMSFLFD